MNWTILEGIREKWWLRMQHKKKRNLETPDENWLVSYSDMMTLLLYLFVILYAMAVLNEGKVKQTMSAFYSAFSSGSGISMFDKSDIGGIPISNGSAYAQISKYIKDNNLDGNVTVKKQGNGICLELQEKILFDPGSADIKLENREVLDKISILLKKLPNDIIVEGYTDNQPINSGYYQSNWELSSDRAVKILRYFTDIDGLKPERFEAVGYGQYKPIADNGTLEGRQKNRRVDIVIVENNSNEQ